MKNDEKNIKEELKSNFTGIETLSIGVTITIGEYAIADKLANFLIQHTEINVRLHYGNTFQLLKLLDNRQISMTLILSGKSIAYIPINILPFAKN